jgi:hypothetical protein
LWNQKDIFLIAMISYVFATISLFILIKIRKLVTFLLKSTTPYIWTVDQAKSMQTSQSTSVLPEKGNLLKQHSPDANNPKLKRIYFGFMEFVTISILGIIILVTGLTPNKYNSLGEGVAKINVDSLSSLSLLIIPAIGIIVIIIGSILFIKSFLRTKDISYLLKNGQKIQGVIIAVQNIRKQKNRRIMTYQVVVSATDSEGNLKNYLSDRMGSRFLPDTGNFLTDPISVTIYIDSINSNKYYIDVPFLPSLTPERIVQKAKSEANNMTS